MKNCIKTLILMIFIFTSIFASGQDKIYLLNGQVVKAIITEAGKSDIEYKKFESRDSLTYFVPKNEVKKIIYAGGTEEIFQSSSQNTGVEKNENSVTSLASKDIITASEFVFYGLDFSNFSLIEEKRLKQADDIKNKYYPAWNKFFEDQVGVEKLKKWFAKTDVAYNPDPVTNINSMASTSKTVVANKYGCNIDSMPALISKSVSQYAKGGANYKIGFVINIQYFDKATSEASAYCTFFDTETNAIISSKRVSVKKADGNGLTNYWGTSLIYIIKDYVDKIYRKGYL